MKDTRKLVLISLFIALDIIATRFLAYEVITLRISFTFIPIALCAMLFGPVYGGLAAAIADLIGVMIFPKGAFFPGFTLSAFLTGFTYGAVLYKKPKNIFYIGLAVCIVSIFIGMGLNTLWVKIMYNKAFFVLLYGRAIKEIIMIPIQVFLLSLVWKYVGSIHVQRVI